MQLPLFLSTFPLPSDSALVMLAAGEWTVRTDRQDAILNLSVDGTVYHDIQNEQIISVPSRSPVRASIVQKGTEKFLSLYLDDSKPD
jgi:hypothetical protein